MSRKQIASMAKGLGLFFTFYDAGDGARFKVQRTDVDYFACSNSDTLFTSKKLSEVHMFLLGFNCGINIDSPHRWH